MRRRTRAGIPTKGRTKMPNGGSAAHRSSNATTNMIVVIEIAIPVGVILFANVRDHRWLPAARLLPCGAKRSRRRRDAGSHSVDRIVRIFIFHLAILTRSMPLNRAKINL